jgi:hypothetical protein
VSVVPVPGMRTSIEERPEGLRFIIPAPRQVYALFFYPVWLVFWALGEGFAITELSKVPFGMNNFLLLWLTMWTLGGASTLFTWLWMLAGQERVTLEPSVLRHRRELFGIGLCREYDLSRIRRLRVAPQPRVRPLGSRRAYLGLTGGVVAFDYGARTVRFGASLDEPEGRMIVQRLKERYGFDDAGSP